MRFFSENSMKSDRNSTTEKSVSFHPLARTHAAVMEAFRSHRRKKDEGIQFTGYELHLCGQGCNKAATRVRRVAAVCHCSLLYIMV